MTTELEAKLTPGNRFKMPAIERALKGAVAVPQAVRQLDAVYYDTSDLELARWGITLRHRDGEAGPRWTLKLPERESAGLLVRSELCFDGPIAPIPDDAQDLVRAFTRGSPLIDVARLHTTRTPLQVHDARGRNLLEIVDDSVSVLGEASAVSHFREVEIEAAADRPRNRAALRAVVAAFVNAGCRADQAVPKLVRALGPKARQPPSVAPEAVGKHASAVDLVQHLSAISVAEILTNDPRVRQGLDPEAVHQYRVATRRLRADLRTFSRFLDNELTERLRDELRWLGHAVGPVRDLDVLHARFADHVPTLAEVDQPAGSEVVARLVAMRRDAHQRLLAVLRSDRYDHALCALVEFASERPVAASGGRKRTRRAGPPRRLVSRRWDQLAAVVDGCGATPTDEDLHRIRISAKRCRYAAEAIAPVAGRPARRFANAVAEIQSVLGDHHDTIVAETSLRDTAKELPACNLAIGALIAIERQERALLRDSWPAVWEHVSRPKLREWL
jgi:CHAD domain-containing protein